jgi:hypothetical protein
MAASDLIAGTVMDLAASLLNDTSRTVYTYAAQLPYLKMALQELREQFELNSVPVTQATSALVNVPAGQTVLAYNAIVSPLPNNFVEPIQVWESPEGQGQYIPMTRKDFLPLYLDQIETSVFGFYSWNGQEIRVPAANMNNDIKLDYVLELFPLIDSESSIINVVNAQTFLQFRTAALCAEFIERNITSADKLNMMATLGMDRALGISSKSKQVIVTRRRPFRGGYKRGGWVG